MNKDPLVSLEIKISHHEDTIEKLQQVVTQQELHIYQLQEKLEKLIKEICDERKSEKQKAARNEPPPHY